MSRCIVCEGEASPAFPLSATCTVTLFVKGPSLSHSISVTVTSAFLFRMSPVARLSFLHSHCSFLFYAFSIENFLVFTINLMQIIFGLLILTKVT